MNPLKPLRSPLVLLAGIAVAGALAGGGCAGTKPRETTGTAGTFGTGGSGPPPINGLESLTITPASATVTLSPGSSPGTLMAPPVMFTATGVINGETKDVSTGVSWSSDLRGVSVQNGLATATAPGIYTIIAKSGTIQASAMLTASFQGAIFDPGFNQTNNNKTVLDSAPSGTTQLLYPLDHSLFPGNLTPIYAQTSASGSQGIARLNFQATGLDINYYANCVATDDTNNNDPLPGGGCYVKMPLTLTQLFIATSERQDIKMTARVFSNGAQAPVESQSINVAWSNVGLSGGIYYWSTLPNPNKATSENAPATPPNYILLDPTATNGTAIYRYDFTNGTPAPTITWTDDGGPKSTPPYQGAPAAVNNNVGKGHCIGCHAISNDGNYMALTIGGSASDAANTAILDIGKQTLININPTASTDPNSSPTVNWSDYWKRFRVEGIAAENTWGPNNDRVVSMFRSKLYLTAITIDPVAGTGSVARMGTAPIMPSWTEYATDPFWSQDGTLFAFTSFDMPNMGLYNTDGLNGDMKKRGRIAIASADAAGIHDDAHEIVPRMNNITSFYPSISNDNSLIVFNQSTCGTDPDMYRLSTDYGNQSCDGYDDTTTTLWITRPAGGTPVRLDAANGPAGSDNSWPRFSPDKGNFRNNLIYWIAFSSRRPYGIQVNGNPAATKPQLWIAAVRTGEVIVGDPSWAPVWLPTQNPKQANPQGNHVPQWVKHVVVIDG